MGIKYDLTFEYVTLGQEHRKFIIYPGEFLVVLAREVSQFLEGLIIHYPSICSII